VGQGRGRDLKEKPVDELTISEADVASFRDKLTTWAETLSDGEQAILGLVVDRAFADEPEVEGFGRVHHSDFHIVKLVDKASPKLFIQSFHQPGTFDALAGVTVRFEPQAR
jgi:hypothetical protein